MSDIKNFTNNCSLRQHLFALCKYLVYFNNLTRPKILNRLARVIGGQFFDFLPVLLKILDNLTKF